MRPAPTADAPILRQLPKSATLTIVGGTAAWLRVELPDGLTGYVTNADTEPATRPLRTLTLPAPRKLLDAADPSAATIDTLPSGSAVEVLAGNGPFLLVRRTGGQTGWLMSEPASGSQTSR